MKNLKSILSVLLLSVFTQPVLANIIGSDLENFNPTTDGLGYVTVESGDFLQPGEFNVGGFLDYSWGVLPVIGNSNVDPEDRLLTSNLHFAVGLLEWWSVGMSTTTLHSSNVDENSASSVLLATGQEAYRIDSKVRLLQRNGATLALLLGLNMNRIQNNFYLGEDPGPSPYFGFIYDEIISETFRWAVNVGYRYRNAGSSILNAAIFPIEDQIFYSLGASYRLESWKTYLMGELYGAVPTSEPVNNTDREFSSLEALLGLKWNLTKKLDGHIGMTRGLYEGFSTPDFRIYGGVNFRFGPLWGRGETTERESELDSDGDGIVDRLDRCPQQGEAPIDEFGCPEEDEGALDDDRDGVLNSVDECPETPYGDRVDSLGCSQGLDLDPAPQVIDSDNDGVEDDYDLCPNTPVGTRVNARGCEVTKIQKVDLGILNFHTGTDRLTKKSRQRLMKKIDKIYQMRQRIRKIVIEGHTDNVGKRAYNQKLSESRARTVRRILIKQARIEAAKVEARGYGEDRPIRKNNTKLNRLINRRVEMNLLFK